MPASAASPRAQLGLAVIDLARAWREHLNVRLARYGLSQARWRVLLVLSRHPEGLTQKALAGRLQIEGPTLVRALDALEAEGLTRRESMEDDRRCRLVRLTDAAHDELVRIESVLEEFRALVLQDLSDEEVNTVLDLLGRIRKRVDESGEGSAE